MTSTSSKRRSPRSSAAPPIAADAAPAPQAEGLAAIKAFDANLRCHPDADAPPMQYEVGQTYEIDGEIEACRRGFHACPNHPLDVLGYYPPASAGSLTRYADVHLAGQIDRRDNSKAASARITIVAELSLEGLIRRAVDWVVSRAKPKGPQASGDQGAAQASGDRGAAQASGDQGAAQASGFRGAAQASGDRGAAQASGDQGAAQASGFRGAAQASGDQGAAQASGDQGAAQASGDQGAAQASGFRGAAQASGDRGAAQASGDQGAAQASGDRGAAQASGDQGAAQASGDQGAAQASGFQGAAQASGDRGAAQASGFRGAAQALGSAGSALASGHDGKVRGIDGCALFAVERNAWDGPVVSVACGIVGQDGIKPMVWYRCAKGRLVEGEA